MGDTAPGEADRRRLVNIVRYNTGGPQPAAMTETSLRIIACVHGGMSVSRFESLLGQTIESGTLERTANGRIRVAATEEDPA